MYMYIYTDTCYYLIHVECLAFNHIFYDVQCTLFSSILKASPIPTHIHVQA